MRDRRALRGAHAHRGKDLWPSVVPEPAGSTGEEGPGPGNEVGVDSLCSEHAAEGGRVHLVETPLDVQEERGDFSPSQLEGSYFVGQGSGPIRGGEAS